MKNRSETHYYLNALMASLSFAAIVAVIAAPLWRSAF